MGIDLIQELPWSQLAWSQPFPIDSVFFAIPPHDHRRAPLGPSLLIKDAVYTTLEFPSIGLKLPAAGPRPVILGRGQQNLVVKVPEPIHIL